MLRLGISITGISITGISITGISPIGTGPIGTGRRRIATSSPTTIPGLVIVTTRIGAITAAGADDVQLAGAF